MAGLWSPVSSIWSAIASLHRAARLLFDRCATAPETRPLLAVSRAHPPATLTDCPAVSAGGGEAVIPRLVVRGPMAVALPRSRSPRTLHPGCFWARHCRLCWSSSGADGVPSSAGNGAGSGRWHPLRAPASDPTPITQVKVRTRAKSITGFSLSKPVPGFKTGYQFSGSCLTSLVTTLLIVSEDMIYAVDLVLDHLQLCL